MDPAYTDRLEAIVAHLPEEACAVGLIADPDADWALAAAGDLAATVSRTRPGHTILVSLASDRPDLDHELGAESELGLSDILTGSATMKSVAARSRGRGYIYVPQGPSPMSGRLVLESRAWRRIRDSALARGATMLVLLHPDSLGLDLDLGLAGLILLGAPPESTRRESGPAIPPVLGTLRPPTASTTRDSTVAHAPSARWSRRPRAARSSTMPSVRRRGSKRSKTSEKSKKSEEVGGREAGVRLRGPLVAVLVIAALLAVIVLLVAAARGADERAPFLEQNDSLWLRPIPPSPTADSVLESSSGM